MCGKRAATPASDAAATRARERKPQKSSERTNAREPSESCQRCFKSTRTNATDRELPEAALSNRRAQKRDRSAQQSFLRTTRERTDFERNRPPGDAGSGLPEKNSGARCERRIGPGASNQASASRHKNRQRETRDASKTQRRGATHNRRSGRRAGASSQSKRPIATTPQRFQEMIPSG